MQNPVISVKNLSKSFRESVSCFRPLKKLLSFFCSPDNVINDISFVVPEGKIVGFLGENGAGKSTTLRLLTHLIFPDSGEITIFNENLQNSYSVIFDKMRAMVEKPSLYEYLTARENLVAFLKLLAPQNLPKIDEILSFAGLSESADKKYENFSTGMRQRLALAIIFYSDPRLVVLDEPTSGLDPQGQYEIREMIKTLKAQKKATIFLSSHLLFEVEDICDYVVVIHQGKIVAQGEVSALLSESRGKYRLITKQPEKAVTVLLKSELCTEIYQEESQVMIIMEEEKINSLMKILIENQIPVGGLIPEKEKLEDFYLNLIRGKEC